MATTSIRLCFGADRSEGQFVYGTAALSLALPVLGETKEFGFSLPEGKIRAEGCCLAWDAGDFVSGWARGIAGKNLEESVAGMYRDMFRIVASRSLYRIWHFVPRINDCDAQLENYRRFCLARAEAFQHALGPEWESKLPAASAVGTGESEPVMLFAGGVGEPKRLENPEQVPAYRYPPRYGPRSPSFARAARTSHGECDLVFISGTASIKGSETIHPGDCEMQTLTTLDNLELIFHAAGLGDIVSREEGQKRRFVVYLRREEDFPRVARLLEDRLFAPGDEVVYLRSDICRSDLMVEIEATVVTSRSSVSGRPS